jgi:hypothetical protein
MKRRFVRFKSSKTLKSAQKRKSSHRSGSLAVLLLPLSLCQQNSIPTNCLSLDELGFSQEWCTQGIIGDFSGK